MEKCFICKSDQIVEGFTLQTYQEQGHIVIIKDIPCLECKTCGETYLSTEVVKHLEYLLDTVKNVELEIVSYSAVAA